jgi:hypothetical protein
LFHIQWGKYLLNSLHIEGSSLHCLYDFVNGCSGFAKRIFEHSFTILSSFWIQAMSNYGFEIVQTLIIDVVPAETVKKAMNEINAGKHSLPY